MPASNPLRNPKFWFLILAALLILAVQIIQFGYVWKRNGQSPRDSGFMLDVKQGRLVVAKVDEKGPDGEPSLAARAGLMAGDHWVGYVAPDGRVVEIGGAFAFIEGRKAIVAYGRPWSVVVERESPGQALQRLTLTFPAVPKPVRTPTLPLDVWAAGALLPLVCLVTGLFIGLARLEDRNAFVAALLFFCFAKGGLGAYGALAPGLRELAIAVIITLFSLWSYFFLRFFLTFPSPSPLEKRLPWLKHAALATALVFTAWNIHWEYAAGFSYAYFERFKEHWLWLDVVQDVIFVLWFVLGFVSLALNLAKAANVVDRRRLRILLVGALGLLPMLALYVIQAVFQVYLEFEWLWLASAAFTALFPLAFAYAVVKHRVFGIRLIVRRGLQYALLSKGFLFFEGLALFLALYFAVGPILQGVLVHAPPSILAISLALITVAGVFGIMRLNRRVMCALDRRFFRETYDGRRILAELGEGLDRFATRPAWLAQTVTEKISDSLHPDQVAIFVKVGELVRLPAGGDFQKRIVRRHQNAAPGDFACYWRHVRKDAVEEGEVKTGPCDSDALPAGSLTAQELERMAGREPYALEMDLADPRSWAYDLVATPPACEARRVERAMLERNHTRLVVPLVAHERVVGFLSLGEKRSEEPYSKEDKELLLSVARQLAVAMVYAGFIQEEAEQLKLRHEIAIAREVQEKLFPQTKPAVGSLSYLGACKPASAVGGDCYDFLDLGGGRVGLALGDVSGKGISAALLMASLQAMLRIHADVHGKEVHRVAWDLNRMLCEITDSNRFVTFFYGVYDAATSSLAYVNAGHNPPMLIRPSAGMSVGAEAIQLKEEVVERRVIKLMPTGSVLGVFKDAEYGKVHMQLKRGDLLVIYTDGITEAMNSASEEYGEERLEALLKRKARLSVAEIRDEVFKDVEFFLGDMPQNDDMTLVVAKVT